MGTEAALTYLVIANYCVVCLNAGKLQAATALFVIVLEVSRVKRFEQALGFWSDCHCRRAWLPGSCLSKAFAGAAGKGDVY